MSTTQASKKSAQRLTQLKNCFMAAQTGIWRNNMIVHMTTALGAMACLFAVAVMDASFSHANADLRLCNKTSSKVSVAVGYRGEVDWTTEGWWNFEPGKCQVIFPGPIRSRYFYFYAMDVSDGGEWGGQAMMCTEGKSFTIISTKDCIVRGYEKTGFFEVDTGEQESWTVQLTEPTEEGN